ncbi:hypothetical protein [Escherichia coli]|uniref:tail fiber/spike domain-containing protein n=1 Tax=Escherichia coli TaxID=562 RepID=UPI0022721C78|nr:hypothetical protein [Escherichia coli]MDG5502760.1 hypothetical protein [Escherichia coli]
MATQPTNLPVPSESPRDLKFNAGKIDEFVTSLELKYIDRFGGQHYTIEGLRWLIQQAISSMGWVLIDSFQDGADITLPNQALRDEVSGEYYRWDGPLPKHVDAGSTPVSSGGIGVGAWVGVGDASLRAYLATVAGAASIGLQPGGNLQQAITWVTPEQFGAIGDGIAHPLSERYATLAAAQAVYPFVTSLTQTIDWAACQAAENYARSVCIVRSPRSAFYHFGSNYLELSINSKWDSGYPVSNDAGQCPRMTRNIESTMPSFGQYCIVRVKNASSAGSSDEFVRGVVFKGYCLTYGLASRSASKNSQRICLHLNYAMGSCVEVAVKGGEYGVFGYSFWGSTGVLVIDSCHKGFYADPVTPTPENPTPPANSNTSFDFRVKVDACPFGIVVRSCQYSKFTGFVEGAVIGWANYDSTNETAVAVTAIGCVTCKFFLGIEAWQGAHLYANNGNVRLFEHWNQGYNIVNTTGKQGAYYSMSQLMSTSDPYPIPSGNNCMYYALNSAAFSLCDINCDMSNATTFANVYFCSPDSSSSIMFDNCSVYFGSNGSRLAPANWSRIDVSGGKYISDILVPNGYSYMGKGKCVAVDYTSTNLAVDGTATITPPTGYKIIHTEAYLVTSTATQAASGAVTIKTKASDGSTITYQTGQASTAYALYSRLTLQITK